MRDNIRLQKTKFFLQKKRTKKSFTPYSTVIINIGHESPYPSLSLRDNFHMKPLVQCWTNHRLWPWSHVPMQK